MLTLGANSPFHMFSTSSKSLLLGALLGCYSLGASAQTIGGTITDSRTQKPIPFVNIGVAKRGIGTVSDENGRYQLAAAGIAGPDTVRISSIGFAPRLLPVASLQAAPSVALEPAAVSLPDVNIVATSKLRTHVLGFAKPSSHINLHMVSNQLGNELGTVIHLSRKPALVQSLHLAIVKNEAGPLTFRVNLYRLDANGQPTSEKLLNHDVFLSTAAQPGVLTADLSSDHLVVDGDFLLAMEWVKGNEAQTPDFARRVSFGGGLSYGYDLFMRPTSQAAWTKPTFKSNMPMLGLRPQVAFYATVRD